MIQKIALILVVLSSLARAQSSDPVISRIIEEGKERSEVMTHLDHLTNRIGPRLTSSDRLTQAGEWAVERLKSYGLDARLEPWGTMPVGFNRGPSSGMMVEPREMAFTFTTNSWTAGTTGRAKGEAILAPLTEPEVAALKGQFAGKWVVRYPTRGRRQREGAPSMTQPAVERLEELMKAEGALGTITTSGRDIVTTGGNWRVSWDDLPKDVAITMIDPHFKALVQELEKGDPVVLQFDIRNWFKEGPITLYNVVADLKGSELPDEYVVVGGHLDSWDGATGTTDNGTGASTTIEAARILAKSGAKPRRTIRFMLWSGEEQGLLGSAAWCKDHQEELSKISAVLVHDGGTNYLSGISGTESQKAQLEEAFAPCLTLDEEYPFTIGTVGALRGGGSDHGSYLAYGVPGYFWNQKGRAVYSYGWHTQNDTYDIAIPEYQRHSATVIALGAYGIANLPAMVDRTEIRSTAEIPRQQRVLGVELEEGSLKVAGVADLEGVAAKAGVKAGDVLMELDGVRLRGDRFVLREAANSGEPNKTLVVEREGNRVELKLQFVR